MSRYDDIINLPHHVSSTHKPMPMEMRAAQFAPFAALTGHDEAINETARVTESKIMLSTEQQRLLSETLNRIICMNPAPEVIITYFVADRRKAGGCYADMQGVIKKVDEYDRIIVMTSGQSIPLDDISDIRIISGCRE